MLALAAISFAALVLTGNGIAWNKGDIWVIIAYALWAFIYSWDARAARLRFLSRK